MKIISIAAVTAGGKTTLVNEIKRQLPKVKSLHFDDYSFEGEVKIFISGLCKVRTTMYGI